MNTSQNIDPWITVVRPKINPPSLNDNTADADRLRKGLAKELDTDAIKIDFSSLRTLSSFFRENNYNIRALMYQDGRVWRLLDILPDGRGKDTFAAAVDLGTSTVAMRLVNTHTGETVDTATFHNPQIEFGSDILTRIHFSSTEGGLDRLQAAIITGLNTVIEETAHKNHLGPESIAGMALAGNTTMTHLFLGLDPYWICREPYIPVINSADLIEAGKLNLSIHPKAPVLIFPNVGSYFGGDLISGILASGMHRSSETAFLVDVGTNAEVVVGNNEWLMACAGAAGPALEGGVADMGMMAGPGVIDRVVIHPRSRDFSIGTIGDQPPIGICGSGLISLAAQLFLAGMLDLRGKFVRKICGERLVEVDGVKHLTLVPAEESGTGESLTLSQPDIDGLIRSKAAMYTILTTISNIVGIPLNEIGRFYVAGTFGSYIDPASAITIGMIPDLPMDTYVSLGNTSLEGATRALTSAKARDEAFAIRDRITYLELNVNQEFMNLFSAAKFLPHTDRTLFPSVIVQEHDPHRSTVS